MRTRTTVFVLLLMSVLLVLTPGATRAEEPFDPPASGLVKLKPKSGRFVETDSGFMVPYPQRIPGTDHVIWMEPIPGAGEGTTRIPPFWMARYETRHADYVPYMQLYRIFKGFESRKIRVVNDSNHVDAVTAPTEIYDVSFAFEFGMEQEQPVTTMTLFNARQYTKWLSKLTIRDFRLPTIREWEHACRAGSTAAWHFGDDPEQLNQYACFGDSESVNGYQKVGRRKPNAWGLYDMHGNVAEWVLQPGIRAPGQQILKGGCWAFPADQCRVDSVLRFKDHEFQAEDPMLPQSSWWLAAQEAGWVGFRIIRTLRPMTDTQRHFAWEPMTEDEAYDVKTNLQDGRGVQGLVDPDLPSVIKRQERRDR